MLCLLTLLLVIPTHAENRPASEPATRPTELLTLVNIKAPSTRGHWTMAPEGLTNDGEAWIEIPAELSGDYDMQILLTRKAGRKEIGFVFPAGSLAELEFAGGKGNDSTIYGTPKQSAHDLSIANEVKQSLTLRVRCADGNSDISVHLNGKPYLRMSCAAESLFAHPKRSPSQPKSLGIRVQQSSVYVIHSVQVTPLQKGDGIIAIPPATQAAELELGPVAKKHMKWYLDTTVGAYDAVGDRNPAWDGAARATIRAAAESWGRFSSYDIDHNNIIYLRGQNAIGAGCNDPLVYYARARSLGFFQEKPEMIARFDSQALEGFARHRYPAIRRAYAYLRVAQDLVAGAKNNEKIREQARANVEKAMALLPEAFADADLPGQEIASTLAIACDVSQTVENDRDVIGDRVIAAMERAGLAKSGILAARGAEWFNRAQLARGDGWANTVGQVGWAHMKDRCDKAQALLEEAWQLDPANFLAASTMIDVELLNGGDRNAMEKWFERAVSADPDELEVYHQKMNWLEPKWHGSTAALLEFGRQCAKSPRWQALIPTMLIEAHWDCAAYGHATYGSSENYQAYFLNDPGIWPELQPIFKHYLNMHYNSSYQKTRYAVIAGYCGKWNEAHAMFESLGDRWSRGVLYDDNAMKALIREAAYHARQTKD